MENNIVFKNKEVSKIDSRVLGVSGENKQQILVFKIDEGFIDGTAYLELILPVDNCCDRSKHSIELEKDVENECYKLEVKRSLLKYDGDVKMQLKTISNGVEIYKTATFEMHVMEAINAVESIEEDYPCFVEKTKIELQELQKGLEQICDDLKDTKEEIEQVKKKMEGLASEDFVREEIGKIDASDIDLTDYAKKEDIENLANKEYVDEKIGDIDTLLASIADESEAI